MERTYRYRWTHLPTGATGIREIGQSELLLSVRGRETYQDVLTRWSNQQPETWKYEDAPL